LLENLSDLHRFKYDSDFDFLRNTMPGYSLLPLASC
jgi:hypothetical protein